MAMVQIREELCKACGYCVKFCPKKVLGPSGRVNSKGYEYITVIAEGCVGCCSCARMCPGGAIDVYK